MALISTTVLTKSPDPPSKGLNLGIPTFSGTLVTASIQGLH